MIGSPIREAYGRLVWEEGGNGEKLRDGHRVCSGTRWRWWPQGTADKPRTPLSCALEDGEL